MDERDLREWIERVKDGTISRRQFTRMIVGLGNRLQAVSNRLQGAEISGWDSGCAQLAYWHRDT